MGWRRFIRAKKLAELQTAVDNLGGGGTSDHGALTGLADDDHTQYHTDARGDARYYTQSAADTALAGKAATSHTHVEADITDLGNYITGITKAMIEAELTGEVSSHSHAGGGGPAILKCKGTGTASLDDVEAVIPWAAASIDQLGGAVTISGSEITAVTAGVYKFTVTLRTDSGNRTELFIRTYIDADGASGYTQDTDEIVSDYVSRDGDQDTGAVTLSTALNLAAGAKVEFRGFGDTDGTCVMLPAGTILLIEAF